MRIDELARTVSQSVGTQSGSPQIDKKTMRELLALSPYHFDKTRDLDLYIRPLEHDMEEVLVLDNELPLYTNTTRNDVALRRSPELKEMISIRNIIKILNDSDIRLCKGRTAVEHVRQRSLELLDLRYEKSDIDGLIDEAKEALLTGDGDRVMEILRLFIEIMNYEFVPADLAVNDHAIFGPAEHREGLPPVFRYAVLYNERANELKLINHRLAGGDPAAQEFILSVVEGTIEPDATSVQVLRFLADETLENKGPTIH
jgi:hypothetical protein